MHANLSLESLCALISVTREELNVLCEMEFGNNGNSPSDILISKSRDLDELLNVYNSKVKDINGESNNARNIA